MGSKNVLGKKELIPFEDYRRIFRTIFSVIDGLQAYQTCIEDPYGIASNKVETVNTRTKCQCFSQFAENTASTPSRAELGFEAQKYPTAQPKVQMKSKMRPL